MNKIIILLCFSMSVWAQKTIEVGNKKVSIKQLTAKDFNPMGTWEIFHREWEFNCDYEWKGDEQLKLHSKHLGEQMIIDSMRIYSYSTLMSSFFERYRLKFQEGFNLNKHIQWIDYDCKGMYYSKRFGDKLLAMDIDCYFHPEYVLGEEGSLPLERFYILNEDIIMRHNNYSLIFLQRIKDPTMAGYPKDKEGFYVLKSDYEVERYDVWIPERDNIRDGYVRIDFVNSQVSPKLPEIYQYTELFCSDGKWGSKHDKLEFVFGDSFISDRDKKTLVKTQEWASITGNSLYFPLSKLQTRKFEITPRYNPRFFRDTLTITRFKIIQSKNNKITSSKAIISDREGKPTGMYLIKNDEVIVIDENNDSVYIEFKGTKLIRGWIRKEDVE